VRLRFVRRYFPLNLSTHHASVARVRLRGPSVVQPDTFLSAVSACPVLS
jgi:hypothetical protein